MTTMIYCIIAKRNIFDYTKGVQPMKRIAKYLKSHEDGILRFLNGGLALLIGCLAGHTFCKVGWPVEVVVRFAFVIYCFWQLAAKIAEFVVDRFWAWRRKNHPRPEDSNV